MNAPLAKEQIALLMSDSLTYRMPPLQGTESARPTARKSTFAAVRTAIANALHFLAELPQRRAVLDELSRLSDRELADIGLSRTELSTVFTRSRA